MREIIFKGKRKETNEWVYGAYRYHEPTNTHYIFVCYFDSEHGGFEEHDYEVIPESVCQFTGLKDKNGTDIYVGDIINHYGFASNFIVRFGTYIRSQFSNNDRQVKHHGFYCEPISNYDKKTKIEWNRDIESIVNLNSGIERIGNIYDNPNLLGVRKQ